MKTSKFALAIALAASIGVGSMSAAQATTRGGPSSSGQIRPAPTRPGGDPPAPEPGRGPDEIRNPWHPPTGPGDFKDTNPGELPRPTGPGELKDIDRPEDPARRISKVDDGCVGGKMIDLATDGYWKPSSGWQVRIWIYDDHAGGQLTSERVRQLDTNGEWQYCLSNDLTEIGREILYKYEAQNPFLTVMDVRDYSHKVIAATGPIGLTTPPTSGLYGPNMEHMPATHSSKGIVLQTHKLDTGPEKIDDPAQDDPYYKVLNPTYGFGDIVRWGTQLLDKLDKNGIMATRNGLRHVIEYPINWKACNNTLWTCYSQSDEVIRVALLENHLSRFVIQHELAHSVQDAHSPTDDNVGGEHKFEECDADMNLAYSEGFANFVAAWAHDDDFYSYDLDGDKWNVETPDNDCESRPNYDGGGSAHSESAIAGALWDMHDHVIDGDDTLGMQHQGDIVKMVLAHPEIKTGPHMRTWYADTHKEWAYWSNAVWGMNGIPLAKDVDWNWG